MPDYQPIDYRLRCHTKRTDLPADVLRDIGEAYAEIERLRSERDEASQRMCSIAADVLRNIGEAYAEIERLRKERDEASQQELVKTINTLRVERDEARREICESTAESADLYPREFAEKMGWDCYKENTNV